MKTTIVSIVDNTPSTRYTQATNQQIVVLNADSKRKQPGRRILQHHKSENRRRFFTNLLDDTISTNQTGRQPAYSKPHTLRVTNREESGNIGVDDMNDKASKKTNRKALKTTLIICDSIFNRTNHKDMIKGLHKHFKDDVNVKDIIEEIPMYDMKY